MNTKLISLLILVLIIFFSFSVPKVQAEDYYNSSYSESSYSGNQDSDASYSSNYAPVPEPSYIPNNYNNPMVISSLNSSVSSSATLNGYNNPAVISSVNYGTAPQAGVSYNNSGSNYNEPVAASNYNSPINMPNYDNGSVITQTLPATTSNYSSWTGNSVQSDTQRAQSMYNDAAANVYSSPVVRQAENSGLTVERSGGAGLNPMTGSPVAYAQVDISPYDPVVNAAASALTAGNSVVAITADGVLTGNPIQGNSRSIVIDNNNPTLIGPNNAYSMYRSSADLVEDISSHNASVAEAYKPAMYDNPGGIGTIVYNPPAAKQDGDSGAPIDRMLYLNPRAAEQYHPDAPEPASIIPTNLSPGESLYQTMPAIISDSPPTGDLYQTMPAVISDAPPAGDLYQLMPAVISNPPSDKNLSISYSGNSGSRDVFQDTREQGDDWRRIGNDVYYNEGQGYDMGGMPVKWAELNAYSGHDPYVEAYGQAAKEGYKGALFTGDGVLVDNNKLEFNQAVDLTKPGAYIGDNGIYKVYRSNEQLSQDIDAHKANVSVGEGYSNAYASGSASIISNINQVRPDKVDTNPVVEMPKFNIK